MFAAALLRLRTLLTYVFTDVGARPVATLLLLLAFLPGCAGMKQRAKQRRAAAATKQALPHPPVPRMSGTIMLINEESGFALVDLGNFPTLAAGTRLKTRPAAPESAELVVSEVRKRPFVIADIVKGSPVKGDEVFQ